ncbi:MAG TPA: hypothetical protein VLT33_28120 [Labilithrix sp.]|nr:hypothetical protein [Labilithrix sp.]
MKTWKKVALAIAAAPLAFLAFATWYALHFAMDTAKPFEVNRTDARERVLIATQGSAFKDEVVRGVVDRLGRRPAYVKVIDVASLSDVREADWNAVVVLHTWEMSKPPAAVKTFIDRAQARDRLVVLATSGEGNQHIAGVDTITAASVMATAPAKADRIAIQVEKILAAQSPQTSR